MKKLLAAVMSSMLLMSAGYALAQPAAGDESNMSKDQSTSSSSDENKGMKKKSKKQKRMHKKSSKSNAENSAIKSMGTETDNSVESKKNP